jgi:transposase
MMMLFAGEGWGEGMSRMVIDDEMWFRLEKLLSKPKGRHGKDDRLFMEAIGWMLRTGAAWRDLPPTMVYCARPQFEVFVLFFLGQRGL